MLRIVPRSRPIPSAVPQTSPAATATPFVPSPLQRRIPNILTIARVVVAIAFFAVLSLNWPVTPRQCLLAMALFIVAAVTDALDGHLARKWNATSQFGRVMDPFADKILVVGAFIILAGPGFLWKVHAPHAQDGSVAFTYLASGVPPWIAIVILGRELLITSLRAVLESQGRDFSANWAGKLKMIAQSFAIPLILLLLGVADVAPGSPARVVILSVAYATAFLTVLSGVPYVTRAMAPTPPRTTGIGA